MKGFCHGEQKPFAFAPIPKLGFSELGAVSLGTRLSSNRLVVEPSSRMKLAKCLLSSWLTSDGIGMRTAGVRLTAQRLITTKICSITLFQPNICELDNS